MLPEQFLERMKDMLGGEYEDFLQSFHEDKYQALRRNPLKSGGLDQLENYFQLTPVSWEKNGFYYTKEDQPGKHPLHEAGVYYIQEPSAMSVVPLLEVRPGEKILDLCAAPGGKSTQIAGYLQGEGLLVSNEIHPARAKILSENMERLGVRNACVTNEDATRLSEKFPEYFDRILVDAPCSGEGMFRKNEVACEEWSPENVELCAARQDEILDHAAQMLRPGGRLVYSTCTFAPAENEGSIWRFLERHPEFELLPIDKSAMGLPEGACDGRPEWAEYGRMPERGQTSEDARRCLCHTLRLWPHIVKGEGHFAAVLQKQGELPAGYETLAAGGLEKGIPAQNSRLEAWRQFWQETGAASKTDAASKASAAQLSGQGATPLDELLATGIFLQFGENLYLAPGNMPALKGLKVLRPGLHLGAVKKNRFEPSHALALTLSENDTRHSCQLSCVEPVVSAYLAGQTFPMDGEKGWYVITVDGFSLGWGKLAGGVMKNHYPKGLRKN